VLLFAVLLLVTDYWIVPRPSSEIAVAGWGFMLASVLIACVELEWIQALLLVALGATAGGVIHKAGGKTAALRMQQLEGK